MWANRLISRTKHPADKGKQILLSAPYLLALVIGLLLSLSVSAQSPQRLIIKAIDSKPNKQSSFTVSQIRTLSVATSASIQYLRPASGGRHVLQLASNVNFESAKAIASQLSLLDSIQFAEVDIRYQPQFIPDDTNFNQQWYLSEPAGGLDATTAWETTRGSGNSIIAVLDTGILPHLDLLTRTLSGYDFITDVDTANDGDGRDSDPLDSGDWITSIENADNTSPFFLCSVSDSSWHGTKITGLLVANSNNAQGIAGIDHNASVLPVRVLGKCGGATSDIADAIRWAAGITDAALPSLNPNPAHIISLSFGTSTPSACGNTLQTAINDALNAGTIVITAAGNNSSDSGNYPPGNCDNVINVAASTRMGGRTNYTNFGSAVDISAPGGNASNSANGLFLSSNSGTTIPMNEIYETVSGTSFAAPMAAGVAALVRAVNPLLSVTDISNIIKTSVRPFPTGTTDGSGDCSTASCGIGLLDANDAVLAATNDSLGGGGNGSVRMAQANACVTENDGTITLEIERQNGSGLIFVNVTTQTISATADADFTAVDQIITWQDGDVLNKTISVPIKTDAVVEASEFFTVRIQNASPGLQLPEPQTTTVTLISSNGNTPRTCSSKNVSSGASVAGGNSGGGILLWLLGILSLLNLIQLYKYKTVK